MNVSEGSFRYELIRPKEFDSTASWAEQVDNLGKYKAWLRAAYDLLPYDEYKKIVHKEEKMYEDLFEYMGRGEYAGVCEYCEQRLPNTINE